MPDAAVVGKGFIRGRPVVLGITDFAFMAGSMGSVVGEKLTRAAEEATELQLPLIFVSGSGGGARMQEGILSLMQMAKVSAALARYDTAGGLYVSHPDQPDDGRRGRELGLAGRHHPGRARGADRLRRQADDLEHVRLELPEGFQTSEFLLKHGFVDRIVHRKDLRTEVARIIDYVRSSDADCDRLSRPVRRPDRLMPFGTRRVRNVHSVPGHEGRAVGLFSFLFGKKARAAGAPKKGLKRIDRREAVRAARPHRAGEHVEGVPRLRPANSAATSASKLLDKEKTEKFEERFKGLKKPREGEICMALQHENIVRTYEHGITTKGEPYLVMEWVEGLGLNYLVETRAPQLNGNRINYLSQLCDAVQYMHDNKCLHRDLCPRNVMVDKEGVVKLIDFGLTIPWNATFCAAATAPARRTSSPPRSSAATRPTTAWICSRWA